jgi:hypothetical protein
MAIVLITLPLMALGSVIQLNLTFSQPQGRYLFAGLPALMVIVAIGLAGLPGWNVAAHRAAISLLIAINIYALLGVEFPAYWMHKSVTPKTVLETNIPPELMLNGAVGPMTPGGQFGQTFTASGPNLSSVEMEIANYGKRSPVGFVRLHLRQSVASQTDIAMATIAAAGIPDCSFVKVSFPPINESQGKSYYVFVDTQGVSQAYPITVFASRTDVYSGGELFINGVPTGRDTAFHAYDTIDNSLCFNCGK